MQANDRLHRPEQRKASISIVSWFSSSAVEEDVARGSPSLLIVRGPLCNGLEGADICCEGNSAAFGGTQPDARMQILLLYKQIIRIGKPLSACKSRFSR